MILTHDSEPWHHMVGVDPGETTGFCAVNLPPSSSGVPLRKRVLGAVVFMGQVDVGSNRELGRGGPWYQQEARLQRNIAGRLRAVAENWSVEGCLHLAIEDFTLRERTKDRSLLSPVRMTSGVLALLENDDDLNVVVHLNSAGDAKGTVTDTVLHRLGLYRAGMQHANDAARQAVLALRKEQG